MTDYLINGHEPPCPTTFRWLPRRPVDIQGDARPIYAAPRQAELRFQIISYADWARLQTFFNDIQSTGTADIRVPAFPSMTGQAYAFQDYSGCTLAEPAAGVFFAEHPTDVVLLISNIVTE